MRLAIDLDDCVLDFLGGLRIILKKEYNVDLSEDDIKEFTLAPLLNPIVGRSWWDWLRDRSWLWTTFPAVDGAIGALEQLRRDGHYLVCITSKPRWAEHNTFEWLGKWRPPFQQVIIVGKDDIKADFTDADILIDDKYENCKAWRDSGRLAILFSRPHNRSVKMETGMVRANNWTEVLEIVKYEGEPEQ